MVSIVTAPTTLTPLPDVLTQGLAAVATFSLLSFTASIALFLLLTYRLVRSRRSQNGVNPFLLLIFNLVLADIQQSVAFLLNARWLALDSIQVDTSTCWAQGWFVSTGDLASGVFTFFIACYSFSDIVLSYRPPRPFFFAAIAGCWIFVYCMAIIGIAMHPTDFYARAGAWCWVNSKYEGLRLYLHYLYVLTAEFGTVIIYSLVFIILRRRIRTSYYQASHVRIRAQSAAKLIVAYPMVYITCTLPLVIARLTSMAGRTVSFTELCVAAVMITSNGWLDVLLYTLTRRALLFSPEVAANEKADALDTFIGRPDDGFGTTTVIEAAGQTRGHRNGRSNSRNLTRQGSEEELFALGVTAETVVQVQSEVVDFEAPESEGDVSLTKRSVRSIDTPKPSRRQSPNRLPR